MHPTLTADNDAERDRLTSGTYPTPMPAWMGAVISRFVPTGARPGVFDKLADGPLTTDEVADALELNRHGTTVLLEGLTGFGFLIRQLIRQEGRFRLTDNAARWQCSPLASPNCADKYRVHAARSCWHGWRIFTAGWPGWNPASEPAGSRISTSRVALPALPAGRCEEGVRKAAGQLRPGGVAAVHDVEIAEPEDELEGDDVTNSTVSFAGPGGRCWLLSQYEMWLRNAGLVMCQGNACHPGWYSSLVSATGELQPARNLSMNRYWKHAGPTPPTCPTSTMTELLVVTAGNTC